MSSMERASIVLIATDKRGNKLHPLCKSCGWAKGGVDSWNGHACKCKLSEPPIQLIAHDAKVPTETSV